MSERTLSSASASGRTTARGTRPPRTWGPKLFGPVRAIWRAPARLVGWWNGLQPSERVLYRSLVLLGAGFGLVYPPLVLIVPGIVLALTFFGIGRAR